LRDVPDQEEEGARMNSKLIVAILSIVIEGALAAIKLMKKRRSKKERRFFHERNKSRSGRHRLDHPAGSALNRL
jgi:hypothetical protein